jgi:DNA repair protein RecO (recombination protein O)
MTSPRRVQEQPAFILHHRPFRDTSQLLDIISRDHGKLTLVARGSRASKSRLPGVLRPFQALRLSWFIRSDLGTLTGAEIDAAPLSLSGDALLSAFYVNELVLNFLHRHDPQPEIFDAYGRTVRALASSGEIAANLRVFEMELLRLLGYALNLDFDAASEQPLDDREFYEYRVEQGPVRVIRQEGPMVFGGDILSGIGAGRFDDPNVLSAAGRLLREVITQHLDGKELKSRKVLRDLHRASIAQESRKSGKTKPE